MKTEKIFAIVIVLSILLKYLFGFPLTGIIVVLALSTLSLIYFPFGFYFLSDRNINNQKVALSVFAGMAFGPAIMGILFKVMYWPGSMPMIQTGLVTSVLILAITFLLYKRSQKALTDTPSFSDAIDTEFVQNASIQKTSISSYYKKLLQRGLVIVFATFLIGVIPTSALISFQYREDAELARLKVRMYENPGNKEYHKEHQEYTMKKLRGDM